MGGHPPVAVVADPPRLRAAVATLAVADAGRPAVQSREETRESSPVRYAAVGTAGGKGGWNAPRVRVAHTVDAGAGVVLLLPLEPRQIVRDRPVPVVYEARRGGGRTARRGRRGGRHRRGRGRR